MILKNKNAIVYGAGGSMGSAVAKAFASAGAKVFLTGRKLASVQKVADDILQSGGWASSAEVDGFDQKQIESHLQKVVQSAGTVDISFNAVGIDVIQNVPLTDLATDDFIRPITMTMQTRFMTAAAAGRLMKQQGSGVILFLTATPGGIGYPFTGAFAPACSAVENFSTNLASELGVYGVRVVNIRSGGSPDSKVFKDAIASNPADMDIILKNMQEDTMLKRLPLMSEIADVATFLVSDKAAKITGVTVDLTCGTTAALNYRSRSAELPFSTFTSKAKSTRDPSE